MAAQHAPALPAATVMLVRDGSAGLEVLMLRRTLSAAFASGMYVFPGGKVDPHDTSPDIERLSDGLDDLTASERLGLPRGGLAYWVAAVRECFEEAGVLLAHEPARGPVHFDDPEIDARFGRYRRAVHGGQLALIELCQVEGLRLTLGDIHYVSHWITPVGEGRRFDTRFFVARAPVGQEPLHDDQETIASTWVTPTDALERCAAREIELMPPTVANLQFLRAHRTTDDALRAAAAVERPPTILPKLQTDGTGRFVGIVYPGDPRYAELA